MRRQTQIRYREKSPQASGESSAPRRGSMSSSAAQLPRHHGGRCVVTAETPWAAKHRRRCNPSAVCAAKPAVAVVVAVQDVRTPATPFVAQSASTVRHASVQPLGRTSSVQGTGVHTTGVIGVSGQTGVWFRSRAARTALDSGRRCGGTGHGWRSGFDMPPWSASGLVVAPESGLAAKEWSNVGRVAGTSVDGRPGPPLGMRAGCGAALAAWPTGELVHRRYRSIGWE
jgi:hypothetical protein